MKRRTIRLAITLVLALAVLSGASYAAPLTADAVPPGIAETALAYSKALIDRDTNTAWGLLSAKSHSEIDPVEWQQGFLPRPAPRPPSANVLLRALATSEPPASIGDILVRISGALIEVNDSIQITQQVVLLKQGDRWLVDLAASDQLNARAAAQVFLDAVVSESATPSAPRPVRLPGSNLPMVRALLASQAKDYYVLEADIDGDRARVTLACDLPVNLVLRAVRVGPGWTVDLSRPVITTDPTSPNALQEAADTARKAACEDRLRRLAGAFQMYTQASEDLLPDPDTWVEQMRPFLPDGMPLRCPGDKAEGIGYAMNSNLAGKKRGEIANPGSTPLLYESTLHTSNPSGTGEGWPEPAFHAGGNMVLFVDGSARATRQKPSFVVTAAEPGTETSPRPPTRSPRPRPLRRAP
ncbi:MAG TPA: hypothetical protein VMY87_06465 [Armatimonadota bacterium]|nr:hypothetical protein [Armatimonadota bacterium]